MKAKKNTKMKTKMKMKMKMKKPAAAARAAVRKTAAKKMAARTPARARPKPAPALPALAPHLVVHDAVAAIEFYKRAFAAVEVARHPAPDGKKLMHAGVLINGALVMLNDDFPEFSGKERSARAIGNTPVVIHLNVKDVDHWWKRAVDAGAEVLFPLANQFWGDRYGQLKDPFGHHWSLATRIANPTDAEVMEAGKKAFAAMK